MISIEISHESSVFNGIVFPKEDYGKVVGYAALATHFQLPIPMPKRTSAVGPKNRSVSTDKYTLYPKSYFPGESILDQLTFALKYEGVNLLVLKKLFQTIDAQDMLKIVSESKGIYIRKIWYLYEWLLDKELDVKSASTKINYGLLADPEIQFTRTNPKTHVKSQRHRIANNLLGTIDFCPHVYKTHIIKAFQEKEFQSKINQFSSGLSKTILLRASADLRLKDSKASFAIEGERPKNKKLLGWANAIGTAGINPLSKLELERLQQIVLPLNSKIELGFRKVGGFIGDYDRDTVEPLPEHISAKWDDLDALMKGLIETNEELIKDDIDAIVCAAVISFGFVFIHPFIDGNGRIHRYIIHHILRRKKFTPEGIIFPVSAAIEKNKFQYLKALQFYSQAILNFIEWETTKTKNVKVVNDTIDYYRYFDATTQVEYLYKCIEETIKEIIPYEIDLLKKFDEFQEAVYDDLGLPDNKIKLLSKLLGKNDGKLSKRKKRDLFQDLSQDDVSKIESIFKDIYFDD